MRTPNQFSAFLKILCTHFWFRTLQLFREQAYVVSTLIFPALFFLIFALPHATDAVRAKMLLGSFASFGILAVAVLQFGVQLSLELRSNWNLYLRTLPIPASWLLLIDIMRAFVMGSLTVFVVIATVCISTDLSLSMGEILGLLFLELALAIPFSIMSAALAHWVRPQAALPIFNLIYILTSFAGGLWLPPNALPEKIAALSVYLPTRHMGEVVWAFLLEKEFPKTEALYLLIFLILGIGLYWISSRGRRRIGWKNQ